MSTQPEEEPLQLSRRTISTVFFLCSRALGSLFNKLNMFCQQVWDLPESDRFFPVYIYIFSKCGIMWCRRFAKQLLKSLERLYLCWNSVNIGRMARWWHGVPVWMVATAAGCTSCWRVEVSGTEAWKQPECICEVRATVDFCSTKV